MRAHLNHLKGLLHERDAVESRLNLLSYQQYVKEISVDWHDDLVVLVGLLSHFSDISDVDAMMWLQLAGGFNNRAALSLYMDVGFLSHLLTLTKLPSCRYKSRIWLTDHATGCCRLCRCYKRRALAIILLMVLLT